MRHVAILLLVITAIVLVGGVIYSDENLPRWIFECAGIDSQLSSVAFSPDWAVIALGTEDGTIILGKGVGECVVLTGHTDWVNSVAFHPREGMLASGSDDNTVRLWNVNTGELKTTLTGHSDWVNSVAFSPDAKLLASGSDDNTVRLWNVDTGELKTTLTGHSDWVNSVAFSPDAKLLASGSDDSTVRVWDVDIGELKITLTGHSDWVNSVAFSPTGEFVASGAADNTVRVWDIGFFLSESAGNYKPDTSKSLACLSGPSGSFSAVSVTFIPDERHVASVWDDGTLKSWEWETDAIDQLLTEWLKQLELEKKRTPNYREKDVQILEERLFWGLAWTRGPSLQYLSAVEEAVGKRIQSLQEKRDDRIKAGAVNQAWVIIDLLKHLDIVYEWARRQRRSAYPVVSQEIKGWVKDLGDNNWEIRSHAHNKLKELLETDQRRAVFMALKSAPERVNVSPLFDVEASMRCAQILPIAREKGMIEGTLLTSRSLIAVVGRLCFSLGGRLDAARLYDDFNNRFSDRDKCRIFVLGEVDRIRQRVLSVRELYPKVPALKDVSCQDDFRKLLKAIKDLRAELNKEKPDLDKLKVHEFWAKNAMQSIYGKVMDLSD